MGVQIHAENVNYCEIIYEKILFQENLVLKLMFSRTLFLRWGETP